MASSTQQQFQNVLSKLEKKDKEGVTKDEAYTAASISPITGDAIAIKELPDDVKQIKTLFEEGYREADFKKLGMGALYTTAVTAGLIPVAGVFGRTAKSFLKPVIKKASDEMSSVFKTASGDMNMTPAFAGDTPTINKSIADKEPTSSTALKKDDYQGKKVYHATAKNFKKFGFVSKDDAADIGFHVGTPVQAERRTRKKTGERTLPLQLRTTLKPARIPDLSSFKEPKRWLAEIAVSGKDKDLLRFLMQDPKDANLILDQVENKLPIKMNGTTYYMLPDAERMGMDKKLWKDLVLEAGRAVRVGLDTTKNYNDRKEWFETIKRVANKNGYDSYVYKNEYEVGSASPDDLAVQIKEAMAGRRDPKTIDVGKQSDSYMLLEEDQAKGVFGTKTKGDPDFMKNKGGLLLAEGGVTMNKQMEMFDDGGLKDEGGTVDPVSGNDVPPGSTQEEVRDDIPAQLSEGEFVFPADVVRFIGLEKLMQMRQKAKMGLKKMEEMGQMGNSEEATIPDDIPFDINDLDMEDEEQYNSETTEMAQGGVIKAATGTLVNTAPNTFTQQSQFANQQLPTTNTYTAPTIPAPTAAPVGGFTPQFSGQTSQSGQTVIPTFQNLLGNTDGRYDELREYRSESGMILKIPFINGEPIYPIPEGYTYVDPEEVVEEAPVVKSTTPTTTKVAEQDDGGDDDRQRQDKENMDNFGVTNPTVISLGGEIVSSGKNKGRVTGSMEFSINKTMPEGVIPGAMAIASSVKDAIVNLTTGKYDEKANFTLTPKGHPNVKISVTGKELNDIIQIPDPRDKAKGTKPSITNPKVQNFLQNRVKNAIRRDKIIQQAKETGKSAVDPITGEVLDAGDLSKKSMDDFLSDLGTDQGIQAGSSDDYRSDDNYDDSPSASSFGGQAESSPQSDSGVGDYEDDDMYNQGGLLGKRKIKPKKMKRGGLASR
tara:strand:+ start:388 stop:3198 length:2811 start_codon:yes stop_codon:yes gene_type:complete